MNKFNFLLIFLVLVGGACGMEPRVSVGFGFWKYVRHNVPTYKQGFEMQLWPQNERYNIYSHSRWVWNRGIGSKKDPFYFLDKRFHKKMPLPKKNGWETIASSVSSTHLRGSYFDANKEFAVRQKIYRFIEPSSHFEESKSSYWSFGYNFNLKGLVQRVTGTSKITYENKQFSAMQGKGKESLVETDFLLSGFLSKPSVKIENFYFRFLIANPNFIHVSVKTSQKKGKSEDRSYVPLNGGGPKLYLSVELPFSYLVSKTANLIGCSENGKYYFKIEDHLGIDVTSIIDAYQFKNLDQHISCDENEIKLIDLSDAKQLRKSALKFSEKFVDSKSIQYAAATLGIFVPYASKIGYLPEIFRTGQFLTKVALGGRVVPNALKSLQYVSGTFVMSVAGATAVYGLVNAPTVVEERKFGFQQAKTIVDQNLNDSGAILNQEIIGAMIEDESTLSTWLEFYELLDQYAKNIHLLKMQFLKPQVPRFLEDKYLFKYQSNALSHIYKNSLFSYIWNLSDFLSNYGLRILIERGNLNDLFLEIYAWLNNCGSLEKLSNQDYEYIQSILDQKFGIRQKEDGGFQIHMGGVKKEVFIPRHVRRIGLTGYYEIQHGYQDLYGLTVKHHMHNLKHLFDLGVDIVFNDGP